jgi:DNA modification methylase
MLNWPNDFLNQIITSDCLDAMRFIPDNSIDLAVTSPPYDKIRDYNGDWELDLRGIGKELYRVLKDGAMACLVINDGTKNFRKSLTSFRTVIDWCDNAGFGLFETIIYQKYGRPGAWWAKRFRVDHEYIFLFLKGKRPRYFNKEPLKVECIHANQTFHGTQRLTSGELVKISPRKLAARKCRGTVWFYLPSTTERNKVKLTHPATFPDKLAEDLIICFSREGEIVLDPLVGSGTTAVMAQKLGRTFVGIDVSDEYCQIAKKRLATEVYDVWAE